MQAQWQPNWYPVANWNNTFGSSTPAHSDATPWAVGGNQCALPAIGGNGHSNYSCGTLDGTPFALKAGGVECIYMNENNQHVAIGINHQPSVADCQLDIKGSTSNLRIYGNTDGYIESTTHMRLFYNNGNIAGTANFQVIQGTPTSPTPRFSIDGNGYTSIYEDLRVGSNLWNAPGRLIVDGLTKNGIVIRSDNSHVAMNICNSNGVGKFLVRINPGGGDAAEFRLVGRTQIGFYQTPGWILDPSTQLNVDAYNVHGVKITTNNHLNRMFFVEYNGNRTFEVQGSGKTHIGAGRPLTSGIAAGAMLSVDGMILAKDVRVAISQTTHWADYVFDKNYKLMPLAEVEKFVSQNKHLPGIPSEAEVKAEGVDLTEMNIQLLQKVEELYLHTIEMKKDVENLKKENEELKATVSKASIKK